MLRIAAGWLLALTLLAAGGCCVDRCGTAGPHALHGAGDPCASACCGPRGQGNLRTAVRRLLTCGSGCGELYVDEWLNDPPDCCDPCDNCGNWIGPRVRGKAHPGPLHRGNLWGQRFVRPAPWP